MRGGRRCEASIYKLNLRSLSLLTAGGGQKVILQYCGCDNLKRDDQDSGCLYCGGWSGLGANVLICEIELEGRCD